MNTEVIGTWAGLVWNALKEGNMLGTKQLKKITKLKDKELYAALGWLAREDKIIFAGSEDDKEIMIALLQ